MNDYRIPIDGGGTCDKCGRRSFRHIANGWRHIDCESVEWHRAQLAGRAVRTDVSRARRPRSAR